MQILNRLSVCHNAFEKMDRAEDEIPYFKRERTNVFRDIKQFLMMTLTYFEEMEQLNFTPDVIAANLRPLIESLSLLHALYGYPANPTSTGNILIKRSKLCNQITIILYYFITVQSKAPASTRSS